MESAVFFCASVNVMPLNSASIIRSPLPPRPPPPRPESALAGGVLCAKTAGAAAADATKTARQVTRRARPRRPPRARTEAGPELSRLMRKLLKQVSARRIDDAPGAGKRWRTKNSRRTAISLGVHEFPISLDIHGVARNAKLPYCPCERPPRPNPRRRE